MIASGAESHGGQLLEILGEDQTFDGWGQCSDRATPSAQCVFRANVRRGACIPTQKEPASGNLTVTTQEPPVVECDNSAHLDCHTAAQRNGAAPDSWSRH